MSFKKKLYEHYRQLLQDKITLLQKTLQDLSQSAANETKSTAGDKHETALAMLQIEQGNKRKQLGEFLKQQAVLNKIDPSNAATSILNGSLVHTDKGYFFISIALGKTVMDEKTVFALSPSSPLGQQLMGKAAGQQAEMNGIIYHIIAVT